MRKTLGSAFGPARLWLAPPGLWLVTVPLVAITLLHYVTPATHHMHILHGVLRRLYYVPVVSAALLWGVRGGLAAAVVTIALYAPHVVQRWDEIPTQTWDAVFEMAMYAAVGGLTGSLSASLRRQQDALLRTDQLKSLGTLASGMAHEVRNPLASIAGAAAQLRKGNPPEATRDELLGIVARESARLDDLVREFLEYARPPKLVRTACDVPAVVAEAVALVTHSAAPRSVTVRVDAPPGAPSVSADPTRLKQALLNLLLNAVQASPAGGEVRVSVAVRGRSVRVTVRDAGPGLPAEVRGRLFEPFVTTREGGTGLGLPMAKRIVAAHGGSLELADAEGGGTEARLDLPGGAA
ncbi:MAG: ATP-binding protein [Candidatus Coatesbacteria bacterium]